jgi:hypothetical protein
MRKHSRRRMRIRAAPTAQRRIACDNKSERTLHRWAQRHTQPKVSWAVSHAAVEERKCGIEIQGMWLKEGCVGSRFRECGLRGMLVARCSWQKFWVQRHAASVTLPLELPSERWYERVKMVRCLWYVVLGDFASGLWRSRWSRSMFEFC